MSVPALRQPKLQLQQENSKKSSKSILPDVQYVIVTLRDARKLVVSSDAYHGVITAGESYKCVFCHAVMELDSCCKEKHKNSVSHKNVLERFPHVAEYSENLVRELTKETSFCTICNVVVSNVSLTRHLITDVHTQELEKAVIRAESYKPY